MTDLEALEPYDEREVVQRMERDVRALFLDRELAAEFVAIDLTVLRLQSLSMQVPPWEAGHPMEASQEGVPQWRCCFDDQCEAKFDSGDACSATPQTNGDGVQIGTHQSVSCVFGGLWR